APVGVPAHGRLDRHEERVVPGGPPARVVDPRPAPELEPAQGGEALVDRGLAGAGEGELQAAAHDRSLLALRSASSPPAPQDEEDEAGEQERRQARARRRRGAAPAAARRAAADASVDELLAARRAVLRVARPAARIAHLAGVDHSVAAARRLAGREPARVGRGVRARGAVVARLAGVEHSVAAVREHAARTARVRPLVGVLGAVVALLRLVDEAVAARLGAHARAAVRLEARPARLDLAELVAAVARVRVAVVPLLTRRPLARAP